ncbi:hypothetical protein V8E53_013513 [Lactarius tabidus]
MSWLLDSLTDDEDFERFLAGIPGFYKSTHGENPVKVLQQANTDRSPKAILAFMDRSLSSDLPEEIRHRRIKISLEVTQTHPHLLQRSFHHALRVCSTESTIFKSVDFILLANQHANDKDLNTRSLARCIVALLSTALGITTWTNAGPGSSSGGRIGQRTSFTVNRATASNCAIWFSSHGN